MSKHFSISGLRFFAVYKHIYVWRCVCGCLLCSLFESQPVRVCECHSHKNNIIIIFRIISVVLLVKRVRLSKQSKLFLFVYFFFHWFLLLLDECVWFAFVVDETIYGVDNFFKRKSIWTMPKYFLLPLSLHICFCTYICELCVYVNRYSLFHLTLWWKLSKILFQNGLWFSGCVFQIFSWWRVSKFFAPLYFDSFSLFFVVCYGWLKT